MLLFSFSASLLAFYAQLGNITFKVPQSNGSTIDMTGKLIQTYEDFKILWTQIVSDLKEENFVIRKIKETELKYFWSIIFYDIDEPLFVIDNQKIRLIIDLNDRLKVLFIEAL